MSNKPVEIAEDLKAEYEKASICTSFSGRFSISCYPCETIKALIERTSAAEARVRELEAENVGMKAPVSDDETAWLIERRDVLSPLYAFVEDWGGFYFTDDPNKAVRFARREDAEQVLNIFENVDAVAIEHRWNTARVVTKETEQENHP